MFRTANPSFLLRNPSKMSLMSKYSLIHYNARNMSSKQLIGNEKQSEYSNAKPLNIQQDEATSNGNYSILEQLQAANPLNLMNIDHLN